MSSVFDVVEHVIPGQHIRGHPRGTSGRQEDVLRIAVKQYTPRGESIPDNAITVLGFCANGFCKEMYEPYYEAVYLKLKSKGVHIRGIWLSDCVHQGASGVVNENLLGDSIDWYDTARDTLLMINHFRDQMPRPLIGVSHSWTAAQLVHLCIMHPRLLSSVIICEPVLFESPFFDGPNPGLPAALRRDYWSSRAEAEARLRKAFKLWDPRVLELYLKYSLRSLPTPLYDPSRDPKLSKDGVTLTTTKHQETWSYSEFNLGPVDEKMDRLLRPYQDAEELKRLSVAPFVRLSYLNLPHLRPSCLFVFGNKSYLSPMEEQQKRLAITGTGVGGSGGVRAGKVRKVSMEKANHLIPFEKSSLDEYATVSADWIEEWFAGWLEDEKTIAEHESYKSEDNMRRMTKHWVAAMKAPPASPRPFLPKEGKL